MAGTIAIIMQMSPTQIDTFERLGRTRKPLGVIKEGNPTPGAMKPIDLSTALRPLSVFAHVVVAHFIAHGDVGNAEDGHPQEKYNRPA